MSEIEQRLQESTQACMAAYKTWESKKSDVNALEELQEAVHELRKVASRLEIEMAVSERADMADKPLPIPPHKSQRKNKNNGGDDNIGNNADGNGNGGGQGARRKGGRRGPNKSGD